MSNFVNIAAYKFVRLDDLKERRRSLRKQCVRWGLKGTILLSTEGINLFVAGQRQSIDKLVTRLRADPEFSDLEVKESVSDNQPFNRMLVRIKKEIIAFGVEGIDPVSQPAPKLDPRELKQWLDEGRPVTLLDTRNQYEVRLGTFQNAVPIGIDHFREFPAAVSRLPEDWKQRPVVMFCTGGIRCEKAGPLLLREGFQQIYQLHGGILKYFEQCGGEHFQGECFVFDQRVAVDARLEETATTQCYACQEPLTAAEQLSEKYVPGESCPYCFRGPAEQLAITIDQRHAALHRLIDPLPGSRPYENRRPIRVPQRFDGMTLLDFLAGCLPHIPREQWCGICERGEMLGDTGCVAAEHIVRAGQRYMHVLPGTIEPAVNADIRIIYEDASIIVLNKPAPLPMHPSGRFHRNTVSHILSELYRPQVPRVAHRLDANTTGVVVLSRTRHVAARLQPQFERREVSKSYLVRILGQPVNDDFTCHEPISATCGEVGVRRVEESGLAACTEFAILSRLGDGTSLLEARPITGRTNQIRVHLWHLGIPVCGDPLYLPERQVGGQQTLGLADSPLCLHAWRIGFAHPTTGEPVAFESPWPAWASQERWT